MVSRSVKGIPDEGTYGYLSVAHMSKADVDAATQDGNLYTYLNLTKLGTYDGESDNYYYSAGEKLSGQFVYDTNNSITPLSYTEDKISRNLSNNTFDIVDDDGTDYQFTQIETQSATGITGVYTSSWYLTKIVSYDKVDVITLEYNSVNTGDADTYLSFSRQYGAAGPVPAKWSNLTLTQTGVVYNNTVLLTKIDFKNGFVQFDYQNGRLDRRQYQLNAVSINSINPDNTTNLLKKYTFKYSYFNSGGTDAYNNRLKLDTIKILDKNLQNVSNYSFSYNMQTRLPAYYNPNQSYVIGAAALWLATDYWGYYNGATNTSSIPTLPASGSSNYSGTDPANRNPNEIYMQANMLQQITYPTGGTTVFAFESNKDLAGNLIGGLRINTITSTASATAVPIVKKYIYGDPTRLSMVGNVSAYQYFQDYVTISQCTQYPVDTRTNYFGSYPWPLSEHNGSPIVYHSVQEYTDGGTSPSLRTDYIYDIETDRQYTIDCQRYNNTYFADRSWARGNLSNTYYYTYQNGTYNKVKEIDNIYTSLKTGTIGTGLKVYDSFIVEGSCAGMVIYDYTKTRSYFDYFDDLVDVGIKKLATQTITEFYDQSIVTSTQYTYGSSSHLYPTQEVATDSKNVTITTAMQYVPDITLSGTAESARQLLLIANNISPVLKKTVQKGGITTTINTSYNTYYGNAYPNIFTKQYGTGATFNEYSYTNYDTYGNLLEYQKLAGPFTAILWAYNSSLPIANVTNAKANNIFYNGFEEGDGNINDGKTGHYGHTGTYTKALSGLDAGNYILTYWQKSGSAWSLVSTPVTVTGSTYTIGASPAINAQIDDVRFYPSAAQMTTYTYDPLVGMTSSTDAKGMVTYYDYDNFQRLMNVKDKDGNIVKSYTYHYQGQ